jgi:drug/metabolite transporter (DMT)-like permease
MAWATLAMSGGPGPSLRAVAWGLASGLAGGAGTLVLYRGLARGQMSVVGPVSAVGAAVVPVAAGVALGERPSMLAVAGVLVALPAIVLVAASGSVRGKLGAGLLDGLAAGVAFGILFIGLAQAVSILMTVAVIVAGQEARQAVRPGTVPSDVAAPSV